MEVDKRDERAERPNRTQQLVKECVGNRAALLLPESD